MSFIPPPPLLLLAVVVRLDADPPLVGEVWFSTHFLGDLTPIS